MSDKDLLECCQSVLDFLNEDVYTHIPTPKQKIMDQVLKKNGWGKKSSVSWLSDHVSDMVLFTKYLNDTFNMGYEISTTNPHSLRDFFRNHGKDFYKRIIREEKLKSLINEV